jgi:hypothetical protein
MPQDKPRFIPQEDLRLAVPKYGILVVEGIANLDRFEEDPRACKVRVRWIGNRGGFTLDGVEWRRLTDEASVSRW